MSNKVSFGRIFWPSFVAVIIASVVGLILFFFVLGGVIGNLTPESKSLDVKDKSVLHVKLDGAIQEKTTVELNSSSFTMETQIGLSDLLYGIEKAKEDQKIKGLFVELGSIRCGYATAKEIRDAINDFEKSGKFVVAYNSGEVVSLKEYYISSAANEIYGFPTSNFEFLGLGGELTFYKNTFDKLGVEMQIIRGKNNDFKSAVEPFFLESMSDSSRLQMEVYINNIWRTIRTEIAQERNLNAAQLNQYADDMLISGVDDAIKYKLIDASKYRNEVIEILKEKVKLTEKDEIQLVEFKNYAKKKFRNNQFIQQAGKPTIAVVVAAGAIAVDGEGISSNEVCELLRKARKNKSIKAVVLRVNSPGGSALASDEIWREVELTNQVKKVVVSMGDVAASGGYYISSPASYIFAEPTTITGSIGVFGMIPYTGEFMTNTLGLTFDYVQTNKHSGLSLNKKLTSEELARIQDKVDEIYIDFLERVSEGRGMSVDAVNQIARGRVWTGVDALRVGLVDELGGLNDAINYAAKLANVKEIKTLYYPLVEKDQFEAILEQLTEENKTQVNVHANIPQELISKYEQISDITRMTGVQMRLPYTINLK